MTSPTDSLQELVSWMDADLDEHVSQPYKDQPLAQDWARLAKATEETGEAIAELILMTGQNPRKPLDPTAGERLLTELADTALTALYALEHFVKDGTAVERMTQRARYHRTGSDRPCAAITCPVDHEDVSSDCIAEHGAKAVDKCWAEEWMEQVGREALNTEALSPVTVPVHVYYDDGVVVEDWHTDAGEEA